MVKRYWSPDEIKWHFEDDDAITVTDVESLFNDSRGDKNLAASRVEVCDGFALPAFALPAHSIDAILTHHNSGRQLWFGLAQVLGQELCRLLGLHEHQCSRAGVDQDLLKKRKPL